MIRALEGLTFDTCKGERTIRKEDHQAICDLNFVQFGPEIRATRAGPSPATA